jgi:TonB family protein
VTLRRTRWLAAVRMPRWLTTVPFSLALHVVFVAVAIAVLRTDSALPPLIVDLRAIIVERDDGGAATAETGTRGAASPRAPSRAPASARPSEPTRSSSRAAERSSVASEPASPPAPPVATPPAAPAPASTPPPPTPPPTRAAEPVQTRSSAATPQVRAAETSPPSGAGQQRDAAAPDASAGASAAGGRAGERAGGTSERPSGAAGAGIGAAAGERVAAIAPGAGSADGAGLGSEYAGYYARLRERIQQSLRYPAVAKRRELTGTVELEISIAADGAIAAVTVIGSSSHDMLDRAAVDAARSVRRIPFPSDVRARPLTVRLPVVFHLRD